MGRFTQLDTIIPDPGDPQSLNRYSYVRNNPASRVDPSGNSDVGAGGYALNELAGLADFVGSPLRCVHCGGGGLSPGDVAGILNIPIGDVVGGGGCDLQCQTDASLKDPFWAIVNFLRPQPEECLSSVLGCGIEIAGLIPFGKGLRFGDDLVAAARGARRVPVGALEDASTAAFRAADNVDGFRVPLKHRPGAGGNYSRFGEGVDQRAAIRDALSSDAANFRVNYVNGVASDTSFRAVTDVGRVVGSKGETSLRVVVGIDGQIWTACPVK